MPSCKRLGALLLILCLLTVPVFSAASETDNFVGGYTLTGSGPEDMIAIALAQEGRTGRDFGYDDQWCAYFISDLARIAGETAAIPAHGTCTYLYQNILNAGGTITTSDPKPGDICFINWSGGSRMSHVELVYKVEDGMVYTIGGNSGSASTYQTRCVKKHDPIQSGCILAIVRPAYGTVAEETQPTEPHPVETKPPAPATYTIRYDANGGTGAPKSQTKTEGVDVILSKQIPSREGYRFLYWMRTENACYAPGECFRRNENTTLYAVWQLIGIPTCQLQERPRPVLLGRQESLLVPIPCHFSRCLKAAQLLTDK